MHLSKKRGVRLLAVSLVLAVLAGGLVIPVCGATDGAPGTGVVLADTTVPLPITTTGSSSVAPTATTAPTTKTPTTTTRATTAPTTPPTTAKTSTPATTAPRTTTAPTTAPTTELRTTPPTYQAPPTANLPAAVAVVTAPTIVAGAYTVPPGTGIFTVTSIGNVPVGGDGVVQLLVDNGWQPLFGDTYIDISWDPALVSYQSAAIKVLNTTAAVSSDRSVRVMLGDFRRGYPQGRYPLAAITLRALREGTSTLTVSVDHVRYWSNDFTEFTDITATASGQSGIFSTGPLPVETVPLVTFTQNTLAPVTNPTSDVADLDTGFTTAPTTARTSEPTTIATVSTPPAVTTDLPPPATTQTPYAYGSYAPVSTRVQTSGLPTVVAVAVSLAAIGGVLLVRRRE